jgi:hypothetical protein
MKYITSWKLPPSLIDAANKKFLETGGAPPEAVKMLGRWHGMNGTGFAISESDDPKAMYQRYAQWANVMEVAVTPCDEDAEAGPRPAATAQRWIASLSNFVQTLPNPSICGFRTRDRRAR